MSNPQIFIIPGPPVAWARAGRNGDRYYDTQRDEKKDYALIIQSQWQEKQPCSGPLHLDVTFKFPFPKTKMLETDWVITAPDLDNCIKFLMDAATCLYTNDRLIVSMAARKLYSTCPGTEFKLTPL